MKNLSNKEELELLKRSLDALPRGILITDCQQEDDPIIYVNKYFLEMSGYAESEILGKNCRFMQGKETDTESLKKLAIAIEKRESVTVKMINYRKNGEQFVNEFTISPVKNQNGEVTHCIGLEIEQ
ncbi:MAG: PAS domain-containing protein [Legionellaceae bacterium]|nr:PAS domain-containing protein [Legionellaceae bacterium]MBP9776157.1 PAS domain-containing protein [Legionellaceae bacterium]